jgi:uncharacterized repeat protein (TIGR01451 family)
MRIFGGRSLRAAARLSTLLLALAAAAIMAGAAFAVAGAAPVGDGDTPTLQPGAQPLAQDEEGEEELLALDSVYETMWLSGSQPLDIQQAGAARGKAAQAAQKILSGGKPSGGATFTGAWTQVGPNPIVQGLRSPDAAGQRFGTMSGRIGALAIRPSTGQFILGAAQGGIWLYDPATGTWSPKSDGAGSLAIGALAVAPSNDNIVYAGTGEGALSGDSYWGNGILKSTDGGNTWAQVSGDYFQGVSTSRIVVDPTNANHLYAAILRGRGGARRVSPPLHSQYGVWESKDGGVTWNLIQSVAGTSGATDLEIDPQNPQILYSSFWGDAIYKSTDGGAHWAKAMNGLPDADYADNQTRFSIGISHPAGAEHATLYAGFDWLDKDGKTYHKSRVWKSTDDAASWTELPAGTAGSVNNVEDYCGTQCFYDNVIEVDPQNPDIVFAAGMFNYSAGSGGIYRSEDGGQTWLDMGWDMHPDFHALAINPANPAQVLVGNDGGVWYSGDRGGRNTVPSIRRDADWQSLNGGLSSPYGIGVTHRTGLSIAQYTSIAIAPQVPKGADSLRFWGGTQDNGTLRKSVNSKTWFDVASGDGGQVVVDPTSDSCALGPSCFVYGTYFGVSPYRYTDGGNFFTNSYIRKGIDLSDRSDFYIPLVLNKDNPNQLYLGTYRLYRTDNARAASASDVSWSTISPDLTGGCTGTAPNGARNCTISAIGVGGGSGIYTGSLDGYVYVSPDAATSDTPTWTKVGHSGETDTASEHNGNLNGGNAYLPLRPVSSIAVDRSNWRIAYIAYDGYDAATPYRPGHVFATSDGGQTWKNISGNLPDTPVNSLVLDPSFPDTLYAGTDVGAFVTYNGGRNWYALGTGMPTVAVWQLDLDPSHRLLAAGTHGRGAFSLQDTVTAPALVLMEADSGKPVGPNSTIAYTLTLKNVGNAAASGGVIKVPLPANTSFVSADNGGTFDGANVRWSGLSIPAGGSVSVHLNAQIASSMTSGAVVLDGAKVTASGGFGTTGSPFTTPIAPPFAFTLSPAAQTDGGRVGTSVSYRLTIENLGYNTDSYALSAASGFPTTFFDSTCTTPITSTASVAAGDTTTVCAKVAVPAVAANDARDTATITATSTGSSSVTQTATITTIAVAVDTLLVDEDGGSPNVQSYYENALAADGIAYSYWDLAADKTLPLNYTKSFKTIVWFTGNSYPGPITPYEPTLKAALDNGTNLLMSGQDILDQAAGTTAFVHDYLHITWDGTEAQNDKATTAVHGVAGSPVTDGIGAVPLDHSVLGASFEDEITPNGGALPAFTDDASNPDALSFSGTTYKVVFLAFPLEAYGTAADKADLIHRAVTFFGS